MFRSAYWRAKYWAASWWHGAAGGGESETQDPALDIKTTFGPIVFDGVTTLGLENDATG